MTGKLSFGTNAAALSVAAMLVVGLAEQRASATFIYSSAHRSTISGAGPDFGPWNRPPLGSNSWQRSDLSPEACWGFGGGAIDIGNPGTDAYASSMMEVVFSTDTVHDYRLAAGGQFAGDEVVSVSLWRVDPVTRAETLLARVVPSAPSFVGTIQPGNQYHLLANGFAHIIDSGHLSFSWAAEMPAPGGIALAGAAAMLALRRRRG